MLLLTCRLRVPHNTRSVLNFESPSSFRALGFSDSKTISNLQASCGAVPQTSGVYLVARESNEPVRFLKHSTGGHFKRRDPSVLIERLERRWMTKPRVLYIGKAGGAIQKSNLRERIHSYMQFGLGNPCSHWGGRYIWQLADAKNLIVYWRPTLSAEEPSKLESVLLDAFIRSYGRLPFANLRR